MKSRFVYLTYIETMIFMHSLEQIHNENQYFNDGLANEFKRYVLERSKEIALTPEIKLKLMPNSRKYEISESLFNYLVRLTGINPYDKKVQEDFKPVLEQVEANARAKIFGSLANTEEQSVKRK